MGIKVLGFREVKGTDEAGWLLILQESSLALGVLQEKATHSSVPDLGGRGRVIQSTLVIWCWLVLVTSTALGGGALN